MKSLIPPGEKMTFEELTNRNWQKFEALFGAKGACGGCWCMFWRSRAAEYNKDKGSANRDKMLNLVKEGQVLGVLALHEGHATGWCSISPRQELVRLKSSRSLRAIDELPVWSITCFFIKREFRKKGLSRQLIRAAVDLAVDKGAHVIEAYPIEVTGKKYPDVFAFTGLVKPFKQEGFEEVFRSSRTRPVLRKRITP